MNFRFDGKLEKNCVCVIEDKIYINKEVKHNIKNLLEYLNLNFEDGEADEYYHIFKLNEDFQNSLLYYYYYYVSE